MYGMTMSMIPSLTQRVEQRLTMTLAQRQAVKTQQTMLQIELVATLRDERYQPKAKCPSCGRELKANEILAGFLADVNDFTTQCTGCRHRFEPKLICFGSASNVEIPFFCNVQARERLRSLSHLSPSEIARNHAGEYRSAVVHYGTLAGMFKSIDIEYSHKELEGWQGKVQPFLGRMPDTVIAMCVGVGIRVIRTLRRKHRIPKYAKKVALNEVEN